MKQLLLIFCLTITTQQLVIAQTELPKPIKANPAQPGDTLPLPDFSFYKADGSLFTKKDFKIKDYGVVVFFSPGCGHCRHQAESLKKSWEHFEHTPMMWVCYADSSQIVKFKTDYFNDCPNVTVVQDKKKEFYQSFQGIRGTPTMYVFDKHDKRLATMSQSEADALYSVWENKKELTSHKEKKKRKNK